MGAGAEHGARGRFGGGRAASRLAALLSTPGPSAAVALSAESVDAVQVAWTGDGPAVTGRAHGPLRPGIVTPGVTGANVADAEAVAEVLGNVLERLPHRPSRVALVVPDRAAKVSILRFDTLPSRAGDLDALVRWRAAGTAPFAIDDAQVSYTAGTAVGEEGRELVVAVMHREVVETYERVCTLAGAHAGVVDLASFNLINAVLATTPDAAAGDWLLVHAAAGGSTLAIVRRGALVFYRNRAADGAGVLADLVHQTAMYYEDRLDGRGFRRAVLAGEPRLESAGPGRAASRRSIEARLGTDPEWLGAVLGRGVTDGTGADRTALDALAAPVGILLREERRGRPGAVR